MFKRSFYSEYQRFDRQIKRLKSCLAILRLGCYRFTIDLCLWSGGDAVVMWRSCDVWEQSSSLGYSYTSRVNDKRTPLKWTRVVQRSNIISDYPHPWHLTAVQSSKKNKSLFPASHYQDSNFQSCVWIAVSSSYFHHIRWWEDLTKIGSCCASSKYETLHKCLSNVGPTSWTVGRHWCGNI